MRWRVACGDCREVLRGLPECSVDAVVCDPPYGIDFQHAAWDGRDLRNDHPQAPGGTMSDGQALQAWAQGWAGECLRVLRPGGQLAAFGHARTFHRVACGLEDAGLELRDTLMWLYGTGMPKSRRYPGGTGTSLKPGWEPVLLARRPLEGTGPANVNRYGTGRLNIDACRYEKHYPTNVLLGHHPDCTDTQCSGDCSVSLVNQSAREVGIPRQVSRIFYCPKVSRGERDAGCDQLPARTLDLFPRAHEESPPGRARNPHPTVKPLALMRWLVRLLTPPGGLVLDPFCGSGTTGAATVLEDRRFLGVDVEPEYARIARARIAHWDPNPDPEPEPEPGSDLAAVAALVESVGPFVSAAKAAHR